MVGKDGFEPTQPIGGRFTVYSSSPALALTRKMAEEVRFELTRPFDLQVFKTSAFSRALPLFRKFCGNKIMLPKLKNSVYDTKRFKFTYYLINRVVISITALITAGLLFRV